MNTVTGPFEGPASPGQAPWEALTPARQRAGLSMSELYFRYIALGGSAPSALLAQHFSAGARLPVGEHDLAVLALNERFLEMNAPERLPYNM